MSGIGLSVGNNYDYKKTSEVVQHVHNLRFGPELKSRLFDISVLDSNSNTGSSLELSKLKNDFSTPGLALNNLAVEHIFEKVKELKSELGDKVAGKADKVLISSDGNKITLELFEIKKPKNNPVKCIANFFRKLTPTKFSSEPKIKHVPLKNRRYSEIDLRKVDTSKLESQTKKHNHNPRESKCNNFQPVNGSRNESLNNDGISNAETEYVSEAISSSNKPETNQIKDLVRFAFLDT